MNWLELKEKIKSMTPEQQNTNVTLYDYNDEEFCALEKVEFAKETDVLDKDHPYLVGMK